jgi:hypothetical protein
MNEITHQELKETKVELVDNFFNNLTDFIAINKLTWKQRFILWTMRFI